MRLIILLGGVVFLAVCAKPRQGAASRDATCPLRSQDSTFLRGGPVYRDCAVDEKARIVMQGSRPDFRPAQARNACYKVELEYVVGLTGIPEVETARIVHATDQQFARAVLAVVGTQTYTPARRDGQPVRQIINYQQAMTTIVAVVPAGTTPRPPSAAGRPPC
jgi:hypothetical protein